jgi:hypothetical protein
MKKLLFAVAALCLMTSAGYCEDKAQPLQLTIQSDKQMYEVGEEVKLQATLKNNSDKEMIVFWNNANPSQLTGGGGTTLNTPSSSSADALYIKPKGSVKKILNAGSAGISGPAFTFVFDNTWALRLKIFLKPNQEKFEGSLTSNTITITVKEKERGAIPRVVTTRNVALDKELIESWERQKDFFMESNFEIIGWERAQKMLAKEKLAGGKQYHTGWLTIYSTDGNKYLTKQPKIDALWEFAKRRGLKLEGFATE